MKYKLILICFLFFLSACGKFEHDEIVTDRDLSISSKRVDNFQYHEFNLYEEIFDLSKSLISTILNPFKLFTGGLNGVIDKFENTLREFLILFEESKKNLSIEREYLEGLKARTNPDSKHYERIVIMLERLDDLDRQLDDMAFDLLDQAIEVENWFDDIEKSIGFPGNLIVHFVLSITKFNYYKNQVTRPVRRFIRSLEGILSKYGKTVYL